MRNALAVSLTFVCLAAMPASARAETAPCPKTVSELTTLLRREETRITNLHVTGFALTSFKLNPKTALFELTPFSSAGDAWFTGDSEGPSRIYYSKYSTEWHGGAAPYIDEEVDFSFDGSEGREVRISSSYGHGIQSVLSAHILSAASPLLTDRFAQYATGRGSHLSYMRTRGRSLPDQLERAESDGYSITLSEATFDGDPCVQVSVEYWKPALFRRRGASYFWFDRSRHFAYRGQQQWLAVNGPAIAISRDAVHTLQEAAPGIWYPTSAEIESRDQKGGGGERYVYTAQHVTANDPAQGVDSYQSPFPPGTRVSNTTTGETDSGLPFVPDLATAIAKPQVQHSLIPWATAALLLLGGILCIWVWKRSASTKAIKE